MRPDFSRDHFALFGLPRGFSLDEAELGERYRALQRELHPDRYAAAPEAERRMAVQWAAHVNEAYRTLRAPLLRAQYLVALNGVDAEALRRGAVAPAFLAEQMELREALEDARDGGDAEAVLALGRRVQGMTAALYAELLELFGMQGRADDCAERVRRLQFLKRLREEIEDAHAAIEIE